LFCRQHVGAVDRVVHRRTVHSRVPSSARPHAVHRVPGQARHPDRGPVLHRVHGHHAVRVAHSHQRGHRKVPEEQHGTGPERHLQEGVQLVLHRHFHLCAAAGARRAQLVPDQRGQSEPPEPDAAHLPGKSESATSSSAKKLNNNLRSDIEVVYFIYNVMCPPFQKNSKYCSSKVFILLFSSVKRKTV